MRREEKANESHYDDDARACFKQPSRRGAKANPPEGTMMYICMYMYRHSSKKSAIRSV